MINYRDQTLEKCCMKCEHSINDLGDVYCIHVAIHEDVSPDGICDAYLLKKDLWEQCPNCNNSGTIAIGDNEHGWEPCQCEFCWTNEKSVFYNEHKPWKKEG